MSDTIDIERYLAKRDPDLGRAIGIVRASKGGPLRPPPSKDNAFQALVRAVIYQRTSESSGATVYAHLKKIAKGKLKPANVLSLTEPQIQKAGMSGSKAAYVLNVARWFDANPATAKKLRSMPDEKVIDELTTIQGIGLWSVNVLLVFNFGRLDVAPAPDAVIRGVASIIYGLRSLPSVEFVEKKIETWRPYRSIATMYLYQTGKLKLTKADIRRGRSAMDEAGLRSGT
jgi:3-methyladenine DNA glycosylase/8-oxoguanine DNA glycosylase